MKKNYWLYLILGIFLIGLLFIFISCGNPIRQFNPNTPTIISVFPEDKGNIPKLNIFITATFDKAMNASTVNASSFSLSSAAGSVTGTVSYETTGKMATFKPAANLVADTTYTATISDSVRSSGGDKMDLPYSWSFTTSTSTISGTPDASFGSDGMVIMGSQGKGSAIAVDNFGRILVAGSYFDTSDIKYHTAVWRYNPDGTPDGSFGNGGLSIQKNSVAGGIHPDVASSMVLDSDNKILVAGYSYDPSEKRVMSIWRLNPDGSLDTSFNSSGIVLHPGPTEEVAGWVWAEIGDSSITIDPADRILVTSQTTLRRTDPGMEYYYMVAWRYNPDGSLDSSFSDGTHEGFVVYPGGGNAIATYSAGKVLVVGSAYEHTNSTLGMRIWLIGADGKLERSSDTLGDKAGSVSCAKIDSSGAILVGGTHFGTGGAIWKFDPYGTLDTTFGQGGIADLVGDLNERTGGPVFITLDSAGRILAARTKTIGTLSGGGTEIFKNYIETSRLNSNGSTDESFGSNGKIVYPDYSPPEDINIESKGIITDLYGRILVLGESIQGSSTPTTIFCYK